MNNQDRSKLLLPLMLAFGMGNDVFENGRRQYRIEKRCYSCGKETEDFIECQETKNYFCSEKCRDRNLEEYKKLKAKRGMK